MRLALEPDIEIVGEAGDGETALVLAARLKPDVITMDVEMPRMDGITATATLRTMTPQCAVVILTLHNDTATRARAEAAGAAAFIEKKAMDSGLLTVIRQVSAAHRQ
jgi:pilus assembly protein CpaE